MPERPKEPPTPISPITENIDFVADLHSRAARETRTHARTLESFGAALGRPLILYVVVLLVVLWMAFNVAAPRFGSRPPDPPPFSWMQGVIGLSALLSTLLILISQNRRAKLDLQRAHIDLQVNLLAERKTAKIIELLEELRRDLPNVANRRDSEAEMLQKATNPQEVLSALKETLEGEASPLDDTLKESTKT